MRIGQNQRGAFVTFRFGKGLDRLIWIGAHRHGRHINSAVSHSEQTHIFLGHSLAAGGKLGNRTKGGRFGHLSACIGIHLGIQNQHVDIVSAGQNMIKAAIPNIIGPPIAANHPDALCDQEIGTLRVVPPRQRVFLEALAQHAGAAVQSRPCRLRSQALKQV